MVLDQVAQPRVQPVKGRVVRRQDQGVRRQQFQEALVGGQPVFERVGLGLAPHHTDVGGDLRYDLVARNEDIQPLAVQAGVLGAVPAPYHHSPAPAINQQAGAVDQPPIRRGHGFDVAAETAPALLRSLYLGQRIAGLLQEESGGPAEMLPLHPAERQAAEEFRLGHVKRHLPALAQPAGHADVIGVVVG